MKKNISINIHGVVFHVEENGYDLLREYLNSIHVYFSTFENSSEIITDIEDRIAELFTTKTKGKKMVITKKDVSDVIKKMGHVHDFKVDDSEYQATHKSAEHQESKTSKTRLYRDKKRALAGGVCAGIAHYFSIDLVWPRILFIMLAISSWGTLLLIYIILWIVMPASYTLDEQEGVTKMFRNSENKVLGGVASGLATFLRIDVVLIRVLFIASILLMGSGVILYIVLWIIVPEAKSTTDKVQMHGKTITLSNIEEAVKKKH